MFHPIFLSTYLSWRDWVHELGLSLCGVLALASMLAPLLILHGVHNGVIEQMRENLMRDPAVLTVIPAGSKGAGFDETFLDSIRKQPGCRFCLGRTRNVASEVQLTTDAERQHTITFEATALGDPMLEHYAKPHATQNNFEIVLTSEAAKRLQVQIGERVHSALGRRLASGKFQRITIDFVVIDILPPSATSMDAGFVAMNILLAIQDFRDGISSDLLRFQGDLPPVAKRYFESFRAYAKALDDVEILEKWFVAQNIPVKTRSRDIANIKKIDKTLGSVIMLIVATACAGFFAFMVSTAQAAVRRKWKIIGMLRLTGFTLASLLVYPIMQSLTTGGVGALLAFCLYGITAMCIDTLFAAQTGGAVICTIPWTFFVLAFACVEFLAILASLQAALRAASIEPSTVIREL